MLRCAICASMNKNNLTESVTIINGTAVCFRHIHEASVTRHFLDAWSLARNNEARVVAQVNAENQTPEDYSHYFVVGNGRFCFNCGMTEEAPIHIGRPNG